MSEPSLKHVAWACRTCNKIDWVDAKEQMAKPEHVCIRGVDVGACKGKMIKLYAAAGLNPEVVPELVPMIEKLIGKLDGYLHEDEIIEARELLARVKA